MADNEPDITDPFYWHKKNVEDWKRDQELKAGIRRLEREQNKTPHDLFADEPIAGNSDREEWGRAGTKVVKP